MSFSPRTRFAILLAAALGGCGGPSAEDGGMGDAGMVLDDAGTDSGELPDLIAPTVLVTIPSDGEDDVVPSTSIRLAFSESIRIESGTITVTVDSVPIALEAPIGTSDARELSVTPSELLPTNTNVEVVVDGFSDLAGNAMSEPATFAFTTSDPFAPSVISATPAEGASVDPQIGSLEVTFSEVMNAALGAALLSGGPGTIEAPVWNGARATFALSGLAPDMSYRVELVGFADPAGNALDGTPYLGDGALDFTTGPDVIAPVVTESSPSEGQTGIPPTRTTRIRIVFSEPMDDSVGTAELDGAALAQTWASGGTVLLLDVNGLLQASSVYRVMLSGFADLAGNALDANVYLVDGALDFATGEDELPPFVLYTNPAEGMTDVHWSTSAIYVTFSEAMDTTRTAVPVTDGVSSFVLTGAWSSGGALLTIDVDGALISGRSYVLDFTAFYDADGLALDATHAYLRDGQLSFTTVAPRGENCQDFLTNAQATVTPEGHRVWTIPSTQVTNVDGAAPCDRSGGSPDAVVRYTKVTPDSTDPSGAGRVLRITVSTSAPTSPELNVDVLRDVCDPTSLLASSARLACRTNSQPHVVELDVPPGDYFVWVASSGTFFRGATVEIEEVPAGLGDTCRNAIPISVGTNPLTATGTQSLLEPSCIAGTTVTWYRYTPTQGLGIVRTNAGALSGVMEAATGRSIRCGDEASTEGAVVFGRPGEEVCVAITSSASITQIEVQEMPYSGVRGIETDLDIHRAASAPVTPLLSGTGWMAPQGARIWSGRFGNLFHAPLSGGDYAWETQPWSCRYAGLARPGGLYCVRETTAVDVARLYRVVDASGAMLAAPEPVDVLPGGFNYANLRLDGLTWDGTQYVLGTSSSSSISTEASSYYTIPDGGGAPVFLGSNTALHDVGALAADDEYLYVYGRVGVDQGIYRLRRNQLSDPAQVPALIVGGYQLVSDGGAIAVDNVVSANALYFRPIGRSSPASRADIVLVLDPRAATPRWVGPLWRAPGLRQDNGFGYDPSGPSIYLIHTNGDTGGIWLRLD